MTVEVRELGPGDDPALVELFEAVLPDFTDLLAPSGSGPTEFLSEPTAFVVGAYVDDEPAGLAWGIGMRSPNGRVTTYLHQLDVREEYRRQGIATALIDAAMARARREGHTKFWLSTGAHNTAAQALYESLAGDRKALGDVNYWWDLS